MLGCRTWFGVGAVCQTKMCQYRGQVQGLVGKETQGGTRRTVSRMQGQQWVLWVLFISNSFTAL